MASKPRPLSPHLQIYRLPLLAVLSISHRITAVANAVGTLFVVWWLAAAAAGPDYFALANGFFGTWLGQLMLLGWTFTVFYHLSNGIRHLIWDTGRGLELEEAYASGYMVIGAAVALTVATWAFALFIV